MGCSEGNRESFRRLCEDFGAVVPFVGAGLSAFAYPCWRDFLLSFSNRLRACDKAEFLRSIEACDYEVAASMIEKQIGQSKFRDEVKAAFGKEKLYDPAFEPVIRAQAVYLLPELFKGLVLTTNFDAAIERAYELHDAGFRNIGHPGNLALLKDALLSGEATLYKFHGDISEPEGLVLTKERYDSCYRRTGALVKGLRACFSRKSMLFLGCSLTRDRTMDVLREVLKGCCHYAVLDCEKEGLSQKRRELNSYNIRAILYPEKEHGAVLTVLKKLKENLA